ncbi:DUF1120 domain-containing protein [Burkholderia multivorans]|uniref:DUF1120 domain-containing protein n=1 Tax=Burkholderia multivorans TaxID=87883 RepID=UPI00018E33BF|nr:DUF1120 domain-containing protein [Burkholderia multivorans]EED99931.1 conserved hypothetical protein [Burkholderia multivorans CGD1]MBR8018000.1 DUF1120 domain-containing protein [Burkholderia multivorans]MBU9308200.1 DUF1120 domain-containing protein [Burkholderia multivorans]MBU9575137.1 DUF1120 domain-containing protein [Burkholderia multivorans]MCA8456922.1 DUF1120 domain-containing protein [Burkholderia multivorans]
MTLDKKFTVLAAIALLAGASTAFAASSGTPVASTATGTLAVTGALVPGTCSVTLQGGGKADFGTITSTSLNAASTTGTPLGTSPAIPMTVSCTAPTQIAFRILDNRASSLASITSGSNVTLQLNSGTVAKCASSCPRYLAYGLGTASNNNAVGVYSITADTFAVDGTAGAAAATYGADSKGNFGPYSAATAVQAYSQPSGYWTWVSSVTAKAPTMGQVFTANLYVTPTINNTSALPLNTNIPLDGNATVTIFYI